LQMKLFRLRFVQSAPVNGCESERRSCLHGPITLIEVFAFGPGSKCFADAPANNGVHRMTSTITEGTAGLKERWNELKFQGKSSYTRNDAKALGVSEAELLNTRIGDGVVRLRPEFQPILMEMVRLGKVTAITRNDHVVH